MIFKYIKDSQDPVLNGEPIKFERSDTIFSQLISANILSPNILGITTNYIAKIPTSYTLAYSELVFIIRNYDASSGTANIVTFFAQ